MKRYKDSFAKELYKRLVKAKIGEVEIDSFPDESGMWINLKIGNKTLEIGFDPEGDEITGVIVWKDIVQVVDHKRLFG